jgi:hypothetical protein
MEFGRPQALWLLALAAPVVLSHLYRGRVRTLEVPAIFLWEQVLPVDDLRSGFRRLRNLVGLLVALLALAVLTSALADPTVKGLTRVPRRVVLIVDTSREMTAERLADAKSRAKEILDRLARRDSAAVFDAGGLVEPSTEDAVRRRRAVDRLHGSRVALSPEVLLAEARASDPPAALIVLSSRPWPPGDATLVPIGAPKSNVAIVDPRVGMESGLSVVRAIAENLSASPVDARLDVWNRNRVIRTEGMRLAPRERREVSVTLDPQVWPNERFAEGAFVEIRIRAEDARPEDDAAGFIVPPTRPVTVVVISATEPDQHLMFALDLLEQARSVRVETVKTADLEAARAKHGKEAVFIFDRVAPPKPLPDGGFLVVGPDGPAPRARVVEAVKIVDWDRNASIHRWVDYANVKAGRSTILKGEPLVMSDLGPVAVWSRRQALAWIQFGFAFGVDSSDFALTPSFPVFLKHAIQWLAGEGRRAFPLSVQSGQVLSNLAPLAEPDAELVVTTVGGGQVRALSHFAPSGEARIPVDRPGLVRVESAGREEWVGVTGADPVDLSSLPTAGGPPLPEAIPWWRDLPWVIVAGAIVLLLLLVEWILYQRGWI